MNSLCFPFCFATVIFPFIPKLPQKFIQFLCFHILYFGFSSATSACKPKSLSSGLLNTGQRIPVCMISYYLHWLITAEPRCSECTQRDVNNSGVLCILPHPMNNPVESQQSAALLLIGFLILNVYGSQNPLAPRKRRSAPRKTRRHVGARQIDKHEEFCLFVVNRTFPNSLS